jgi:hypothetical protein
MDVANDEEKKIDRLPTPGHENWVQELAFEVALEYFPPEDLQLKFELTPSHFLHITSMPDFKRAVAAYRREIDDEGIAFRLRARKAAEGVLEEMYSMCFDQTLKAQDRLKAMEMLCKYAGFETQKQNSDGGVKLQIFTNLSLEGNTTGQTYEIEVPM